LLLLCASANAQPFSGPIPLSLSNGTNTSTNLPAPAAFWKMDENGGSTINDSSGNGYSGVLSGGFSWAVGSLVFNGSSAVAKITGGTSSVLQTPPVTYSAWVFQASYNQGAYFGGASDGAMELRVTTTTGYLDLVKQFVADIGTTSPIAIGIAAFEHIAMTYDASGNWNLYINGVSKGSGTSGPSITPSQLWLGAMGSGGGMDFFGGNMKSVEVWMQVLTPTQIAALFAQGPSQ
jgi:hypothetical protein